MKLLINDATTMLVYSKECWNETDIEIETGEEYKFEAVGKWKDLFKVTDAEGYSNQYMRLWDKLKRSKENKWFALIGSLDKTHNFLIGKNNQICFTQGGKLCCFANDVPGFYWNNSGHVKLKVSRTK